MNKITFFTKACCPLCDSAWFVVNKLRRRIPFEVERIDVAEPGQERWHALYADHIPVIHVNGVEVFRHRVSERELREALEAGRSV